MAAESESDFDREFEELERELADELEELPSSDREDLQRSPHLSAVVLYTSDVEELAEFYCAVFGFERRYESASSVELQAGAMLLLIADDGYLIDVVGLDHVPPVHESRTASSFLVENVEECYEAAVAMGASSVRPPHDTEWGMRSCWLRDPAGHLLEIGRWLR